MVGVGVAKTIELKTQYGETFVQKGWWSREPDD
jgi:hypothetical protein